MPPEIKTDTQTKTQANVGSSGLASLIGSDAVILPAPSGKFSTYRRMMTDPTVALARLVANVSVLTADWSVQSDSETPDEVSAFASKQTKLLWPRFVVDALFSQDFGFAAFEKVYELQADGLYRIRRLKYLMPERTSILIDDHGEFVGLKNGQTQLDDFYSFVVTYDKEGDNLYGRSRHENIRRSAWWPYEQARERLEKYLIKTSGIIPIVEYPQGEALDDGGAAVSNFDMAKTLVQNLGIGNGVVMENTLAKYAMDFARSGVNPSSLRAWNIKFLESTGNHGEDFLGSLRYYDSLKFRGWLVPERVALEGQNGTKAESESQAIVSEVVSTLFVELLFDLFNRDVLQPVIELNFGASNREAVRVEPEQLTAEKRAALGAFALSIVTNASQFGLSVVQAYLDVPQLFGVAGMPLLPEDQQNPELVERAIAGLQAAAVDQIGSADSPLTDDILLSVYGITD